MIFDLNEYLFSKLHDSNCFEWLIGLDIEKIRFNRNSCFAVLVLGKVLLLYDKQTVRLLDCVDDRDCDCRFLQTHSWSCI